MVKLELLWSTNPAWSHWEGWNQVLNDDAPEEAKRSYQRYLHQLADIDRRTERNRIIPKGQTGIDYYKKEEPLWEAGYYDPDLLTVFSIPSSRVKRFGRSRECRENCSVLISAKFRMSCMTSSLTKCWLLHTGRWLIHLRTSSCPSIMIGIIRE